MVSFYTKMDGIYQPSTGEAYSLFDCNVPKDEIEDYLQGRLPLTDECLHDFPKPHELGLELILDETKNLVRRRESDPKLLDFIAENQVYSIYPSAYKHLMSSATPVQLKDLKYIITARNNQDNSDVAQKLTTIMNDVYLRFGENKPFTVAVIGKDDNGNFGIWEE
ncbi:MAG: hypothetical protein WC867_02800 [Candidatus Pacearchaeota archaeon]|jgi:hypothetical protein